jgi:hypothetical protein
VSNASSEDYGVLPNSAQGAMPNGYVQGYVLDPNNPELQWTQPQTSPGVYNYRFNGVGGPNGNTPPSPGFGYSCFWNENVVMIGEPSPINGFATFTTWDFVSQKNIGAATLPFGFTPSLYPAQEIVKYTQHIQVTEGNLLFSVFNNNPGDVISIMNPQSGSTVPYSTFTNVQNIGADKNSQSAAPILTRFGFAQGLGTYFSQSGQTLFLAVNDPQGAAGAGRLVIYAKIPSS